MTPGLHLELPIEQYHGDTSSISKSGLDAMSVCPALYRARYLDPLRAPAKERAGQLEGSLAHCAILEPKAFTTRYKVLPVNAPRRPTDIQRNAKVPSAATTEAILWWDEWMAAAGGATIITHEQAETAWRQAESVRGLPEIAQQLQRGQAEVSAYWEDPDTRVMCRCRPDYVCDTSASSVILLDVKTFSSAAPDEFRRQIARKRYHVQDAFYSTGYAAASSKDVLAFIFLTVEPEPPYLATAIMLDDPARQQGHATFRRNLNTYSDCLRSSVWPTYSNEIQIVSLPNWAFSERDV